MLVGKLLVNFLSIGYRTTEHFSLALTADALIRRNQLLLKEVVHFGVKY